MHSTANIDADQDAAYVKDDGFELGGRHGLTGLAASDRRAGSVRRRLSGTEYANDGRQNRNEDDGCNDIVDVLADVGDQVAEGVAPKDRSANPEDTA